jgi:quercetin dioxygenase-like cupin family protein
LTLENPVTGQTIDVVERDADVLVLESSYRAGGAPAPLHYHPSQDEHFEVLSGVVRARIGGEKRELEVGETLDVPAGAPHEFGGHPDRDGRVRWEIRPPLRTLEFFEKTFGLAAEGKVNPKTGVPGLLQIALIMKTYDAEIRLVRPARGVQKILFGVLSPLARVRGLDA